MFNRYVGRFGNIVRRNAGVAEGQVPFMTADGYPGAPGTDITALMPEMANPPPELSNNTSDAAHDIDIAAGGVCRAEDTVARIANAGIITIAIDSTGDGGRLDGDTLDVDTPYHIMIGRSGGTVVGGFKKTYAKPSAWDYYRRIGSILTDGSSNILPFRQTDNRFRLTTPIQDYSSTNPGSTVITTTLTAPTGLELLAIMNVSVANQTGDHVIFTHPDDADLVPSSTVYTIRFVTTASAWAFNVRVDQKTNDSAQIRHRHTDSGTYNSAFEISLLGWDDERGRNL